MSVIVGASEIKMHREDRRYVSWTIEGWPVDAALSVSIDDGDTWHPLTRAGDVFSVLVAGPNATDNPAGTVVAAYGENAVLIRAVDSPEIVTESGGVVTVL